MLKRNNSTYTKCYLLLLRGLIVLAAKNALLSSHISERTETCQILFPLTKSSCTVFYSNIFRYNYVYNNIYIPSPNPPMFVWKIRWKQMHLIRFFFLSWCFTENNHQPSQGFHQSGLKIITKEKEIETVDGRVRTARTEEQDSRILKISEGSHFIQTKTTHSQLPSYLQWLRQRTELKNCFMLFSWIPRTVRSITGWTDCFTRLPLQLSFPSMLPTPPGDKQIGTSCPTADTLRMTGRESKHTSTGALKNTHCDQEVRTQQAHKKNSFWRIDVLLQKVTYLSLMLHIDLV